MTNEQNVQDFSQLQLDPELVQAVTERGYTSPTPIQAAVIPTMLTGQDVIGQAQTGTGKTAAFALPILQNLEPTDWHVQSLVLAPTRELALQVSRAFQEYGRHRRAKVLAVYGGQPYGPQIRQLKQGAQIVVGTPGRLLDLIKRGILDLSRVRTVVLDEADEMLSMGFIEDIETILAQAPAERQTALFSATLPPAIRRLAQRYMQEPQSIAIQQKQRTVAAIEQRVYLVNESDKLAVLTRLFEVESMDSALIFARTRHATGQLASELTRRGYPAEALNGDLSQEARERVLRRFQGHRTKVLVATDIAARGLDIDHISHVFNFDLPQNPEVYVHRVGRTGRAGKTGVAITLMTPKEQGALRRIEKFTRQKMALTPVPTTEAIQARRDADLLARMTSWLERGQSDREREMVASLVQAGHDPLEVAAAALKLAQAEEKRRPIEPVSPVRTGYARKPARQGKRFNSRGHRNGGRSYGNTAREPGMVRLHFSAGRTQGVRPNDVVGIIARQAEIPGRVIGAIRIQEQHTFVDVPEQFVEQVLARNGRYQLRRRPVTIQRA